MTDKELMQQTYTVPLHEQLASVPENARLVIDDPDGMGTRFIPVGRICREAAAALRERLAQPEPVAWPCVIAEADFKKKTITLEMQCNDYKVAAGKYWLCTTASRQWQGLTDEELNEAMEYWSSPERSAHGGADTADGEYVDMKNTWRYIEEKLREKNK